MLDLEKLEQQDPVVAAVAALQEIWKKSYEPSETENQLREKLQSVMLHAGYALGALRKSLLANGYSDQDVADILESICV